MRFLTILLLAGFCFGQCPTGNRYFATNFSWDAVGVPDTRANTWGTTDAILKTITFKAVPLGCRVRIVRVHGDLLSWPLGTVSAGTAAGTLMGLQTSAAGGPSEAVDWGGDHVFLYIQEASKGEVARASFDTFVDALLEPDNKMIVKLATWLNDTGCRIHIEPTMTVIYRYEKEP